MDPKSDNCGWSSNFPTFKRTVPRVIRMALQQFVRGAEKEQIEAWDASIPLLQREAGCIIGKTPDGNEFYSILEYQLPLEARRPDVVVLLWGPIVVLEFKTKEVPSRADIDQVAAYVRDLRAYHSACVGRSIYAVVVPTHGSSEIRQLNTGGTFVV